MLLFKTFILEIDTGCGSRGCIQISRSVHIYFPSQTTVTDRGAMNLQIRISAKDDQGQVLISVEKNRRESYKTNPKTAKQVFDSRCSMNFDSGSANRST